MCSWRDQITISGEWKSCDFDDLKIIALLQDMVAIMLSIIED